MRILTILVNITSNATIAASLLELYPLTGVYFANQGIAEFRRVTVIKTIDEFVLIESGEELKAYDNIVLDAQSVNRKSAYILKIRKVLIKMLYENYEQVVANVKKACERSGRNFQDITIIAVSKTKPLSDVEELLSHGVMEFGENKVQEMVDKYEHVSKPVHWHLIGHLQTNKVKYIVDKACLIHSVDSVHLAKEIEKEAAKKGVVAKVLLEVNIAQEENKIWNPGG